MIPISENFSDYAESVSKALLDKGVRTELDARNEKMQYKIREAQAAKIPCMLIVGEREKTNNSVSVRTRAGGDQGAVALEEFIRKIKKEINEKK